MGARIAEGREKALSAVGSSQRGERKAPKKQLHASFRFVGLAPLETGLVH